MATIIKAGDTFRTIRDVMRLFGKETGTGPKHTYYRYGGHAVWFPLGPREENGILAPPKGRQWLNLLSANREELAEICLKPSFDAPEPDNRRRAVFIKLDSAATEYTFTGIFDRTFRDKDGRVRLYRRSADTVNPDAFVLPTDDSADPYEPVDE